MYRFRDILGFVMYYVYVTSRPSLLIESTDSMIFHTLHMAESRLHVFHLEQGPLVVICEHKYEPLTVDKQIIIIQSCM